MKLSSLPTGYKVENSNLKDQAWEILCDLIVTGQIPPGSKLTEREVMQVLGVGRMPARDALMKLEEQGLVVTRPDARYVIELEVQDIRDLFAIRKSLEVLAVESAVRNRTDANCEQLKQTIAGMSEAVAEHDTDTFIQSDLSIHEIIWSMSGNAYLIKMLHSMIGPISMFITSHTGVQQSWNEVLELHLALSQAICAGDVQAAVAAMQRHMDDSLLWSLKAFEK